MNDIRYETVYTTPISILVLFYFLLTPYILLVFLPIINELTTMTLGPRVMVYSDAPSLRPRSYTF